MNCLGGFALHQPAVLTALTKTSCVAAGQQRVTLRRRPLNVSAEGFRVMLSQRIVLKIYWQIKAFLSPGCYSLGLCSSCWSLKLMTLHAAVYGLGQRMLGVGVVELL